MFSDRREKMLAAMSVEEVLHPMVGELTRQPREGLPANGSPQICTSYIVGVGPRNLRGLVWVGKEE